MLPKSILLLASLLLLPNALAGKFIGYYGNWYQYSQGKQLDLGPAVAAGLTHVNYAFATIAYHAGSDTWYLDLTDPWADVQKPFTACSWNSGGIDMTSFVCGDKTVGNIALAPYVGAQGACPTGCFNDGGDGSTPRICQSTMSYLTHPGYACGQFDWLLGDQKKKYPNVRFLMSVGGWYDSQYFTPATSPKYLDKFVKAVVSFVTGFGFDGIDFDWEYPGFEHGGNRVLPDGTKPPGTGDDVFDCSSTKCVLSRANDTQQFSALIKATRAALNEVGDGTNRFGEEYIVSFASPAGRDKIANYDVEGFRDDVSFMNLMTYDMHGGWDATTNHQAPLYDATPGGNPDTALSIDTAVQAWMDAGLPASKINLGLPFYGRRWNSVPATNSGLYQPGQSPPAAQAIINYRDFPSLLPDLKTSYDTASQASYGYSAKSKAFVTYDDARAFAAKAKYAKEKGLGGFMAWALQTDDAQGTLVKAVGAAMKSVGGIVGGDTATTTSTVRKPVTLAPKPVTTASVPTTTITPVTTPTPAPTPADPPRLVGSAERCGFEFSQACARALCCSSEGYCGSTEKHCNFDGGYCQRKLGHCWV
ncbi:hypothetical protein HK097_007001 [Rhizophlyctis rosea]|uniref:Chitinase n=1 Tax=Rhizophlyctis rosea TaxID=64517 RepID=A0AAD5SDK7_9FUNG|nr:hypothetical protein HK097_007001 [Rhizophlyctis rosea]